MGLGDGGDGIPERRDTFGGWANLYLVSVRLPLAGDRHAKVKRI